MTVRGVFVVLLTVFVSPAIVGPTVFAQGSCEAGLLSQMDRESARFADDVNDDARNFVNDELREAAFAAAKDVTEDSVTAQAVLDLREKWNDWKGHVESAKTALDEIQSCAPNYAFSCLMEQSRETNENIRRWLEGLKSESAQAIRERVEKVGTLYRSYVERAFGNAQTSIDGYMNNCATVAEQRVQSRPTTPAPKSGIGAGTIVTIAGTAIGGAYAWKYYKDTMAESDALLQEFGNIGTPSSSPVPGTTPTTPAPPTGVRAFDGTYDFVVTTTGPGGTQTDRRLTQYLRINNGSVSGSDGALNGTVTASGVFTAVGACPINNDPADWTGTMLSNGSGSGTYRCRTGGISRGWRADNRR